MGSYPSHFDYATSAFAANGVPLSYSRHHGHWIPYGISNHHQHGTGSWINNHVYPNHHQQFHQRHYPGTFSASSPALSNTYGMSRSPYYNSQQYMYNSHPASCYNHSHGQPLYYGFR
ncbi:hypothetical protein BJV82DRAFT_190429 [Fennellomyces sp. T-0311]|nr:hypothetical protein BJV82DRAFT_190429 [Fennellomyces sp. T-0311]